MEAKRDEPRNNSRSYFVTTGRQDGEARPLRRMCCVWEGLCGEKGARLKVGRPPKERERQKKPLGPQPVLEMGVFLAFSFQRQRGNNVNKLKSSQLAFPPLLSLMFTTHTPHPLTPLVILYHRKTLKALPYLPEFVLPVHTPPCFPHDSGIDPIWPATLSC